MPQPIPRVKSKLFVALDATRYSEANLLVPPRSLNPTANWGKYSFSNNKINFASNALSLRDCPPLNDFNGLYRRSLISVYLYNASNQLNGVATILPLKYGWLLDQWSANEPSSRVLADGILSKPTVP